MPRPKEFDVEAAVRSARDVFWRQGFEATSVADLVAATGVGRQSLYDTFGDKSGLYQRALVGYCEDQTAALTAVLTEPGAVLPRLESVFRDLVAAACANDAAPRGCFVISAGTEGADTGCGQLATDQLGRTEEALRVALVRAVDLAELSSSVSPRQLARFLVVTLAGLQVLARARPDPELLADAVSVALSALAVHQAVPA